MINAMYFSPTGTTKKVVCEITEAVSKKMNKEAAYRIIDFTLPQDRANPVVFTEQDFVVFGVPVYAGRVPNVLLKYLKEIKGNGALAAAVVVYGNRNYDDALVELKDILESNEFKVIAAGAFIGEHSFSKILAKDRPDESDIMKIRDFASAIISKISSGDMLQPIDVKGHKPYRPYYMPKDENGLSVDIRKVVPFTKDSCIGCGLCASLCPMGSISHEDASLIKGICIKCGACIKKCPVQAKDYDDIGYLRHKNELEVYFIDRREPEIFI